MLPWLGRYGATASVSLYLTHYPFIFFAVSVAGLHRRYQPGFASLAEILLLCALATIYGWLLSRVTEAKPHVCVSCSGGAGLLPNQKLMLAPPVSAVREWRSP